jgi:hypothetical protein
MWLRMATTLERSPAREQLRDLLGSDVVDELTDQMAGRVLGAVYATARRELDRVPHEGQLAFGTESAER